MSPPACSYLRSEYDGEARSNRWELFRLAHDRRNRGLSRNMAFSIVEVVVASVIIMVVLIPVAQLLGSTAEVSSSAEIRNTANSLVHQTLAQWKVAIAASTTGLPSGLSSVANANSSGVPAPTWPTSSTAYTVAGINYYVTSTSGWCDLGSSSTYGPILNDGPTTTLNATGSTPQPVLMVAVKVTWDSSSNTNHVMGTQIMPTQSTWTNLPPTSTINCPELPGGAGLS